MGHVRDLPRKEMGVDVANSFTPTYVKVPGRESTLREIKKASKNAIAVYLATDPDREGEAISWHIVEATELGVGSVPLKRVVFHEITAAAVQRAFNDPRDIDMQLVNAQQARRVLDRIVGYRLSPVLWAKIKRGLSAGRVQSVALRLIVDRELAIEAFNPVEYWVVSALLTPQGKKSPTFKAILHAIDGVKGKPKVNTEQKANEITSDIKSARFVIDRINRKEVKTRPQPPFVTSSLQQEAARRLRFGAQRTMQIAQQLYEGIQLGSGDPVGLITYMRTDSTTLSAVSLTEANRFIKERFGHEYGEKPRTYKTRSRNAQEAHEAIRPTEIARTPESISSLLTTDQHRLYQLIWNRMVASQMADSLADSTSIDITATAIPSKRQYVLRATGWSPKFDGFRRLYTEGRDDDSDDAETQKDLPRMSEGDQPELAKVGSEQKFTQPPARYSEAMLIRALEEKGIGRPSTYASIVSTIEKREYVEREARKFKPTRLGLAVTDLLVTNFPDIMDLNFTAGMESKLDSVADGAIEWAPMLGEFYEPFDTKINQAYDEARKVTWTELAEKSEESCEKCERPMVIASGRRGKFLACTGFPECRNSRTLRISTGAKCPQDSGDLLEKQGRTGRKFYGCENFPDCDFSMRRKPLEQPCPECDGLMVSIGRGNRCMSCEYHSKSKSAEQDRSVTSQAGSA